MTAAWDAGPCDWPDDPDELDRQLAAAERAFLDLHGPTARITAYRNVETVTVIGGML
ncbi:hypothetical protein ACIRD2_03240 [Streptomyces sp. NPDC093595]|uniref:hypothetical protein n=1 Tax=Streptomyces sp. NPDC093595 TaxID=3366045 RepID=UPI00380F06C9